MSDDTPYLVIYHGNCCDGFTAAWAANRLLDGPCELFAATYAADGEDVDLPDVTGRRVYMVDFCVGAEQLHALAEAAEEIRVFDHHYHAKRMELYPLGPELERTIGFAARWVSDQDQDDYELQLLRGWARRWMRQQRRLAGDPGPEAWAPAIEAHVERLAGILRIEPDLASRLAVPPTRLATVEDDCQAGAICEGSYEVIGGFPRPHACIWFDGSGTSNGIMPEGPIHGRPRDR